MAPRRLKKAKNGPSSIDPVSENDYIALGDNHEEAMRKHRVGDPAKAARFADRALDTYARGLACFPQSFDLAYNRARLELEKATDTWLSPMLPIPVIDMLRQALTSHYYARNLDPDHTDTLFNLAQVLTSIAEITAEDDDADDAEACRMIQQALEIQSRCLDLQRAALAKRREEFNDAVFEASEHMAELKIHEQADSKPAPEPQDATPDEQWATIEEPVSAETLLETITAQLEALSALCSVLSYSSRSSPDFHHAASAALSWIDSYSENLLSQILPSIIADNQLMANHGLFGVMLSRAVFIGKYLELSFRLSKIDVDGYQRGLEAAFAKFTEYGLDSDSDSGGIRMARAHALILLNTTLADTESDTTSAAGAVTGSHAALRWKVLIDAQSHLVSIAKTPGTDQHNIAATHQLRGDISLLLQMLAYPPAAHPQARATTPQLLKNAEIYYRNASKLFGAGSRPLDSERIACEFKGAVVRLLQQVAAGQAASGSSLGQDNTGTTIGVSASAEMIKLALEPVLRARGEEWVMEQIEDMIDHGLVAPEVFSAVIPC
ncbi:hypothetical protein F5Y14DRAFT_87738 [Nemania sp. NC0429]|nr:hypothetical protein F5Y14DRAFT_87738 [Nemania sp. NC0429]